MEPAYGYADVHHPRGPRVRMPFPAPPGDDDFYRRAFEAVDECLAAGWLTSAPGLEQGEQKEMIGWVCKRVKRNGDNSTSAVIAFYVDSEHLRMRKLTVYLDNDEMIRDFEAAAGVSVASLPTWPSKAFPTRGEDPEADRMIVRVKKPFEIVIKPNPKYNPAEAAKATQANPYKIPALVLGRYGNQKPKPAGEPTPIAVSDFNAEMNRIGWKWAAVIDALNTKHQLSMAPDTRFSVIDPALLGAFYRWMKTQKAASFSPPVPPVPPPPVPPVPPTSPPPPAKKPVVVEIHRARMEQCHTEKELEMAKELVRLDKSISNEDKDALGQFFEGRLRQLRGEVANEDQEAEFVSLLAVLSDVETPADLAAAVKLIDDAAAAGSVTGQHVAELRAQQRKIEDWHNSQKRKK